MACPKSMLPTYLVENRISRRVAVRPGQRWDLDIRSLSYPQTLVSISPYPPTSIPPAKDIVPLPHLLPTLANTPSPTCPSAPD